jgi:hypothetical protein
MLLNCCWRAEIDVAKESNKSLSLVTDDAKCDRVAFVGLLSHINLCPPTAVQQHVKPHKQQQL